MIREGDVKVPDDDFGKIILPPPPGGEPGFTSAPPAPAPLEQAARMLLQTYMDGSDLTKPFAALLHELAELKRTQHEGPVARMTSVPDERYELVCPVDAVVQEFTDGFIVTPVGHPNLPGTGETLEAALTHLGEWMVESLESLTEHEHELAPHIERELKFLRSHLTLKKG